MLFEPRHDGLQSLLLLGHRGFQFSDCRFLLLNLAVLFLHFAMLFWNGGEFGKKRRQPVKTIRRKCESPIRVSDSKEK